MWLLIQAWRRTRWRVFAAGLLAALGLLAIVNFARELTPITTDSDFAVTELYVELATRGRLLLGPYSRFGWNHPGPLYFYLQAPLYDLSGHKAAALFAGALALNLAAIVTLVWAIARENRGPLLVLVTALCLVFAWRVPRFLASPWTAHIPILPGVAFAVLCAAVANRRWELLPLTVLFGSFVAQTHLALVPMAGALAAALLAWLVFRKERDRSLRLHLHLSAWICIAVWLLPISEALSRGGGNLAALWRFFIIDAGPGHTLREALMHWSYGLTGVLRPDFGLPWGGHIGLQYLWWAIPCAIAQTLLLAVIARRDFKSGRQFDACVALSTLLTSVVGLWALTRIRGDILDHEIFWLAAFGAMNLAVIGAASLREVAAIRGRRWSADAVALPGCMLLLMLAVALGVSHLRNFTSFELRRTGRGVILATHEAIRAYVRDQNVQRPLVRIDNSMWTEAAGALLRLYRDGIPFGVTASSLPVFTDAFSLTGREDAVITIGPRDVHREMSARPLNVVVLEAPPVYVDAIRITPVELR